METVKESEVESVEELELEDFELEGDTVSAQSQFAEKMQKAFNDWESMQKEAGKRRTSHQYLKNSKRTQQHHHTPSLDMLIALQGSWMLIERDLQAHRLFG